MRHPFKVVLFVGLFVAVSALSYYAGSQAKHSVASHEDDIPLTETDAFRKGLEVGNGRFAWIHASENSFYLQISEKRPDIPIKDFFVEGMWLSVIELDKFVRNPNADPSERKAATNILKELVAYFANNPKDIEDPLKTDLSENVAQGVEELIQDDDLDAREQKVLQDIHQKSQGPLSQLEGAFDSIIVEVHKRDLETQAVLERLDKAGFIPGEELKGAGITFLVPEEDSTAGSSDDEVSFEGESVKAESDGKILIVNGNRYGSLSPGDIVDFRRRGLVFVNQIERFPLAKGRENESPANAQERHD